MNVKEMLLGSRSRAAVAPMRAPEYWPGLLPAPPASYHREDMGPTEEAATVAGVPAVQAGLEILKGACPKCGQALAVCGPGQIYCVCGTLLNFVKAGGEG